MELVKRNVKVRDLKVRGLTDGKRSGMFRTVRGANATLAFRCCHSNLRFEDYREARRA